MDSESESIKSHTESEEDDIGCYFLQPSPAPYNITERVHQANVDLYNARSNRDAEKKTKVKFREELVSLEPDDPTDDDVNSIESDRADLPLDTRLPTLEYSTTLDGSVVTIFNIEEDVEEVEEEEEVLEEVESDSECKHEIKVEAVPEKNVLVKTVAAVKQSSRPKATAKSKAAFLYPPEVICKDHCIDKLDHDLSVSIKKLDIQEKISLPPLQLLQRKCCDEMKKRVIQNLPTYNGLRSEYGLTSRQLEKREKQKELLKTKQRMREQLIEEYKQRKMQQNEKVFCQWLRDVSKRKEEKKSTKRRAVSAKQNRVNSIESKIVKERPRTANASVPKMKTRKKQPSQAHVYIEIPSSSLEKHMRIGDLTITNTKLCSRNLHIITIY